MDLSSSEEEFAEEEVDEDAFDLETRCAEEELEDEALDGEKTFEDDCALGDEDD